MFLQVSLFLTYQTFIKVDGEITMMTFEHFLDDPVNALSYGYEAWLIDYVALWASILSFNNCKKTSKLWVELLTDYTLLELPIELLRTILITVTFISLPLTFWVFGIVSYFTLPRAAIGRKKNRERAMCAL